MESGFVQRCNPFVSFCVSFSSTLFPLRWLRGKPYARRDWTSHSFIHYFTLSEGLLLAGQRSENCDTAVDLLRVLEGRSARWHAESTRAWVGRSWRGWEGAACSAGSQCHSALETPEIFQNHPGLASIPRCYDLIGNGTFKSSLDDSRVQQNLENTDSAGKE